MNEIKTDLFPENLRAARNDMGKQETGVSRADQAMSMKSENEDTKDEGAETMTPAEPLPGTERPV